MDQLLSLSNCIIEEVSSAEGVLRVVARSDQTQALCPSCRRVSGRVHSSYIRAPRDLPLCEQAVRLQLHVRRFRCLNTSCVRRTFAEALPELLSPRARRTSRLIRAQHEVGLALSGEAAARLLDELSMTTSADTVLRNIRAQAERSPTQVRVLGVDDWALRKGRTYGTILVDLEKHCVIDLLEDRTGDTLARWLEAHPGIEIIARDRSTEYARGASEGAPNAKQVADRWHLLLNLQQMLERWLQTQRGALRRLPLSPEMQQKAQKLLLNEGPLGQTRGAAKAASQATREQRLEQYHKVKELYAQGTKLLTISKTLGMSRGTVRTYAYADTFPEWSRPPKLPSMLDPYLSHLHKRHAEGCENASQLWREIQAQGFSGKRWQVLKWMKQRRRVLSPHTPYKNSARPVKEVVVETPTSLPLPSAKRLAWLLSQHLADLSTEDALVLAYILQDKRVALMREQAISFRAMVRKQKHGNLNAWLDEARTSGITTLQTFAKGLEQDREAVRASLETPYSNGQTEGQVNRLKTLKRQMYGRANFDLLRQRVLLAT